MRDAAKVRHLKVSELPGHDDEVVELGPPLDASRQPRRRELLPHIFGQQTTAEWGEALNEPVFGTDMLQLAAQRSLCKVLLVKLQSRLFDLLALGRLEAGQKRLISRAILHETDNLERLSEHMFTIVDPNAKAIRPSEIKSGRLLDRLADLPPAAGEAVPSIPAQEVPA